LRQRQGQQEHWERRPKGLRAKKEVADWNLVILCRMGAEDDGNVVILRATGKAGDASLRLQIGGGYRKNAFQQWKRECISH
jgi:hypothetical protein